MVYAITDNGKNLTPAEKHGPLRVILSAHEQDDLTEATSKVSNIIRSFRPSDDHLLLIGHPLLIAVAFHQALSHSGYVRVLVWNRENYSYKVHTIQESSPDYVTTD